MCKSSPQSHRRVLVAAIEPTSSPENNFLYQHQQSSSIKHKHQQANRGDGSSLIQLSHMNKMDDVGDDEADDETTKHEHDPKVGSSIGPAQCAMHKKSQDK